MKWHILETHSGHWAQHGWRSERGSWEAWGYCARPGDRPWRLGHPEMRSSRPPNKKW